METLAASVIFCFSENSMEKLNNSPYFALRPSMSFSPKTHKKSYSLILFLFCILAFLAFKKNFPSSPFAVAPVNQGQLSEFASADLTKQALAYISRSYYDPSRFNPKQMLKSGLLAISRSVPEIVVNFPDNTARIDVAVEEKEKKFTLPVFDKSLEPIIPFVQQVFYFIEQNYKGEVELPDIERTFINGMLETLDPHSSLLPPKMFKEFKTQTEGEFGGLGIVVGLKDGDLTVISPLEGTPAWKAGIKPKDKIIKIGNEATINMNLNEAVEKLRGKVGSQVSLTLTREGVSDPFEANLTRAKIKIESIQSKLLPSPDGDVAYIKVKGFQEDTFKELTRNLKKLKDQSKNFKGLVLDFRNNPGGLLGQAVDIADLFLDQGVIVSTVGAGDKIREVEQAKGLGTEDKYPIVVLANEASASASEIVAAALKNNNRSILLGEQTFGKGSVQSVYSLKDGSALKLTIAQYLTPGNESIQSVGITPDILLTSASIAPLNTKLSKADGFREKDLEKHLESTFNQNKKPIYQVLYYQPKKNKAESLKSKSKENEKDSDKEKEEDTNDYSNELKLDDDYYVQLGRKIVLGSPNSERQENLKHIDGLLKSSEQEEEQKISTALAGVGVDWGRGTSADLPQAQVSFSIEGRPGQDILHAGEEAKITLKIKNIGKGDFYQLLAKTESENPVLKNKEFVFGKIKSGETKTWTTKIKIPEFALSREDEVKFVFKELNGKIPESFSTTLTIEPKPHPFFAYSYHFAGNPKSLQKGDKIKMLITVKNLGPGKSKETVVNLKNLGGEGIFVAEGRVKLEGLEPNASKEATLIFNIDKNYEKNKFDLELSIVDQNIQEFVTDKLRFELGQTPNNPPQNELQTPPSIELTGIENSRSSTTNRFYVSGQASSEVPLKDVLIFANDNKVYLKSAGGDPNSKKIIFSSQVPLEKPNNLITVIARNARDLASHRSFYIRKK